MGPPRHLALVGETSARHIAWPVPFADGVAKLLALRGQRVVVLASGDPFWFGAGAVLARHLEASDWVAYPGVSIFSLVASRMGWALEKTICLGLHAAPLSRMRAHLTAGARLIVLVRGGAAVAEVADYLAELGFGTSGLTVWEAVGGPNEVRTGFSAGAMPARTFSHPVCMAIECAGNAATIPKSNGIPDEFFDSDGTMTKRPVRALTLSALAPRPGEYLWDIGGGSGSIAIEWLLSDPTTQATAIEIRADRAQVIRANAVALGMDRLSVVEGDAPGALTDLPIPDAVFIGGGLSETLLEHLHTTLPAGTRIVANGVTLEAEALLAAWHTKTGGELMRIEIANAAPLGRKRGWRAAFPIVQWNVTL
ncbi:MAG: precorrin-6Y C5,15-methyltransferase (decarboxylating) [Sulfitobacter sp.]|jgi:precorrin-6Y C5,15-methyltransferase (decarboxylating)